MFKPNPTSLTRSLRRTLAAGTVAGVALVAGTAGVAYASPGVVASASATAQTPVLVGPLLDVADFGLNIGIPTGCNLISGSIGSVGTEYNESNGVQPLVDGINTVCTDIQTEGVKYVAAGQASDTPLAAFNTSANPVIGELGDTFTDAGSEYGSSLAPFGPTISGLGPMIEYFEGS